MPRSVEGDVPDFLLQLLTDVTFRGPNATLIVDCKCCGRILRTHHGKEIASPAHVNQILAYVMHEAHATNRPDSGMLLYALADRDVSHKDAWRDLGHDFYLWTLDLGQPFELVEEQLKRVTDLVDAKRAGGR